MKTKKIESIKTSNNKIDIKTTIKAKVVKQIINLMTQASDENMVRMISFGEKLTKHKDAKAAARRIAQAIKEKHPTAILARKVLSNLNPNCRDKIIQNLFINALLIGNDKRKELAEKLNQPLPWFFVISPTMRCNLKCVGCYAGNYTQKDDLPYTEIDRILQEAKEIGIYFITISGGEPFIRDDILKIFEKHNDMFFQVYTNGTLIDKALAKKLARLGNVAPAISVEGFLEETEKRRGQGVYNKVLEAADNLKNEGVLFGFSATPTRYNSDILSSEEFVDFYVKKGCCFGWYFQYIPIGLCPNVDMMSTPEQRNQLRLNIKSIRAKYPIFIGDFWNDGPYVHGCMAGARQGGYFHIISTGDVEPCVFCHFAVDNIKEKHLIDIVNSKFFKEIRKARPYCKNKNLLTPCLIIDNPEVLRKIVKECGARPTHPGSDSITNDPKITNFLDKYSKRMKEITDPVWDKEYRFNKNSRWYHKGKNYKNL